MLVYRDPDGQYAAVSLSLGVCVRRPSRTDAAAELSAVCRDLRAHGYRWRPAPAAGWLRTYWRVLVTWLRGC